MKFDFTKNKSFLITGGTGSFGKAMVQYLFNLKNRPKSLRVVVFSRDELKQFEMQKIYNSKKYSGLRFFLGDVRDKDRLNLAIRNVDIVFHAAAMKHIDICEENPFDAVKTNVVGTSNILEASIIENISKFIFISTDKATNPTSTLGGSKLLAERLTLDASSYVGSGKTKFAIVRFGNVIGSRGSVFQIFQKQITNKEPITVTDARMTRFIMSISEAAEMILNVTSMTKDGEIFILKMPSVKIEDLAKGMLEVFKKRFSNSKITSKIKISKSRERERFHEFLVTDEEIPFCHDVGRMYKITKTENKLRKINSKEFSSETATRIDKKRLHQIINELIDDYITY